MPRCLVDGTRSGWACMKCTACLRVVGTVLHPVPTSGARGDAPAATTCHCPDQPVVLHSHLCSRRFVLMCTTCAPCCHSPCSLLPPARSSYSTFTSAASGVEAATRSGDTSSLDPSATDGSLAFLLYNSASLSVEPASTVRRVGLGAYVAQKGRVPGFRLADAERHRLMALLTFAAARICCTCRET